MTPDILRERVRAAFVARGRGDYDGLGAALTEQAVYRISGDPCASSLPGEVVGRAAILETCRVIDRLFDLANYQVLSVLVEEPHAVARVSFDLTCRATGISMMLETQFWFTFSAGGLVAEIVETFDTAGVVRLMQHEQPRLPEGADAALLA
jgi:ketosteroid isomerase-like protein